jgi:hypothetical protein
VQPVEREIAFGNPPLLEHGSSAPVGSDNDML